ncbi:IclR family transcriptional regulator [Nocardioides acrostichi]|uniref:IclR family transcriptional regulator n=1 Tax=Nocardioides acrostichi TaxID=2784339 RepID=A0A930V2R2_9ACTN|nr:IclR family transcriptional regulator [Nocardioides acrostichi]MBF4162722.1 IclR family transcriptional regulator [Nocardioides acrostichi]
MSAPLVATRPSATCRRATVSTPPGAGEAVVPVAGKAPGGARSRGSGPSGDRYPSVKPVTRHTAHSPRESATVNASPDHGTRAPEPPSILSKAFELLRAFNSNERVMTLSELSRASGLPKSTVHRLIARLIDLDAIEQHRSGYKLGLGLLELGATTPAAGMRDVAMPYLAALHRWSGQTVHLAVLRRYDVVYLEKLARADSPSSLSGVGARLPANCTAIGKALLAWENLEDLEAFLPSPMPMMTPHSITGVDELVTELRTVRTVGMAHERNEAQLGLACVATPLVVHEFAVGAISVAHRADTEAGQKIEHALHETAVQIAKEIREGLTHGRSHWFPREV